MQQIPLQAIPNQKFNLLIDGNQWVIELKTTNGCTSASITLNGVVVVENARAAAAAKIIPAKYQENGNFVFVTQNSELPDYTQFGVTQRLIYFSAAELTLLREKPEPPITTNYFNPIAALPLRFSPQGYILAP